MSDVPARIPGARQKRTKNKYGNEPVEIDGVRFPSKKEARRWGELKLLERAGDIRNLQRQVPFKLIVNGQLVGTYVADAVYTERAGERVVEDTKSPPTRKNSTYRLKAKLMAALHQPIREV